MEEHGHEKAAHCGSYLREGEQGHNIATFECSFHCYTFDVMPCDLMQDAFNQRMEIIIRSKKEGKLEVKSGFYSEANMKIQLKFPALLGCIFILSVIMHVKPEA